MDFETRIRLDGFNRDFPDKPAITPDTGPITNPDPTNPARPYIYPAIFPAKELPYGSIKDFPNSVYTNYWC